MAEEEKTEKGAKAGGKPALSPEQEAEAAAKKAARAEAKCKLISEFKLANSMEAPRLTKITINMGLGEAVTNPKVLDSAVEELGAITGQRPVVTKAKKSIAVFKLRAGQK